MGKERVSLQAMQAMWQSDCMCTLHCVRRWGWPLRIAHHLALSTNVDDDAASRARLFDWNVRMKA